MTIKVEIAILRGCRMNMQFVFVEVYFNNLYRDPFLFVKRGIKKMLNFPYEVQHISLFLIIDQRYFEEKNCFEQFYAQITQSSVVFTIISYNQLKEKYISKENISVSDSWHWVSASLLPTCNPDLKIDIMAGGG